MSASEDPRGRNPLYPQGSSSSPSSFTSLPFPLPTSRFPPALAIHPPKSKPTSSLLYVSDRKRTRLLLFLGLGLLVVLLLYRQRAASAAADLLNAVKGGTRTTFPDGSTRWNQEELEFRRFNWVEPAPDASLERQIQTLTMAENETRNWIRQTRPLTQAGVGVGLGSVEGATGELREGATMPSFVKGGGPGKFMGGSEVKHRELYQEWQTGRETQVCRKADWMGKYEKLHREMVSGARPPRILQYNCHHWQSCGGLADRVLGITTTFLYSLLSGRAFLVLWEHPIPFDTLFDSPNINWASPFTPKSTIVPASSGYSFWNDGPLIAERDSKITFDLSNDDRNQIDPVFNGSTVDEGLLTLWKNDYAAREGEEPGRWIRFILNRGLVFRSFLYPSVKPLLEEIHFDYDTAYNCIIHYLMRPKPAVLRFISQYTSLFALPSVYVVGIQIRTGDTSMTSEATDAENTVLRHQEFFDCASKIGATRSSKGQKIIYYLISDSAFLKAEALKAFPDRVVLSGLGIKHLEIPDKDEQGKLTGVEMIWSGMMDTIAESWIMSGTDAQVITRHSGFGKIPSWMRGRQGNTIDLQNWFLYQGPKEPTVDCGSPKGYRSFKQISAGWSMG